MVYLVAFGSNLGTEFLTGQRRHPDQGVAKIFLPEMDKAQGIICFCHNLRIAFIPDIQQAALGCCKILYLKVGFSCKKKPLVGMHLVKKGSSFCKLSLLIKCNTFVKRLGRRGRGAKEYGEQEKYRGMPSHCPGNMIRRKQIHGISVWRLRDIFNPV